MKNRKRISVLLVLAMAMTMLAGLAAPAAASTRVIVEGAVATHPSATAPTPRTPGRIDILRTVSFPVVTAGDQTRVRITLPAGITWVADPEAPNTVLNGVYTPGDVTGFGRADSNRTAVFTVDPVVATTEINSVRFLNLNINVPANFTGNIDATVALRGETGTGDFLWEQTSTVRIASIVTGATTATALETLPVLKGVAGQAAGRIRIVEVVAGSLDDAQNITLTAPAGVTFAGTPAAITTEGTTTIAGTTVAGAGTGTLTVNFPAVAGITTITVENIALNVVSTVPDGPINIAISGAGATAASVAIANVGVAGAVVPSAVYATTLPNVSAGQLNVAVADIRLTENMTNAFLGNRMVTFALPSGFTWNSVSNTVYQPQPQPAAWAVGAPAVSADGRTLTFWTIGNPDGTGTGSNQFNLTGIMINAHITAPAGPIVVTVDGNTGASGTVTVGTLRRPVTVTAAAAPDVRADSLGQALGNLVITETFAGALQAGTLTITLPAGVTLVGNPAVAATIATGGTLPIFGAVSGVNSNVIGIPVTGQSAVHPATVTVSGIRVNLDRVPAGTPVTATVAGSAILGTDALGFAGVAPVNLTLGAARGTVVAEVALGNVISKTFTRSVFTIGALSFVRDGVTTTIDAAPTVVEGRTLLPLRFAALAVGVSEDDIIWDSARRTVTLLRGDRVVQLRIGDQTMTINGVVVPLEVPAAISNGRTVLPIRAVATALRAGIVWDATARTVTVTAQ
jgi:hypothetical protein